MVALHVSALHCHSQGAFLVPSERCSIEEQTIEYCGWAQSETFHNWPHTTGHDPHKPLTHKTTWVAYKALTTPRGWQPYAETCRDRIWNVLIIKNPLLP
jgi:hypothetical protein